MTRRCQRKRRGAVAVESAIVYAVLFVLLLGLLVGGLGVFRYQQVACQAREATRWAAVRAADWQKENKQAVLTREQLVKQAVLPYAAGMDATKLVVQVHWVDGSTGTAHDWDATPHRVVTTLATGQKVSNRVRVTVVYRWVPEALLAGPIHLTSISELP